MRESRPLLLIVPDNCYKSRVCLALQNLEYILTDKFLSQEPQQEIVSDLQALWNWKAKYTYKQSLFLAFFSVFHLFSALRNVTWWYSLVENWHEMLKFPLPPWCFKLFAVMFTNFCRGVFQTFAVVLTNIVAGSQFFLPRLPNPILVHYKTRVLA